METLLVPGKVFFLLLCYMERRGTRIPTMIEIRELHRRLFPLSGPFGEMDPYLLLKVFITSTSEEYLNQEDYDQLLSSYGVPLNNDLLEFIGDRVFNLVVVDLIYQYEEVKSAQQIHQILVNLIQNLQFGPTGSQNRTMSCLGKKMGLCRKGPHTKACADVFEALIGAMYLHLRDVYPLENHIFLIQEWCNQMLQMDSFLTASLTRGWTVPQGTNLTRGWTVPQGTNLTRGWTVPQGTNLTRGWTDSRLEDPTPDLQCYRQSFPTSRAISPP